MPHGKPFVWSHYVDANLMHNMLTGRSATGIKNYVNGTSIDFFSKKPSTGERATYSSKYVAAWTCVEQIIDLNITLQSLGINISGQSYMLGDNESVVNI